MRRRADSSSIWLLESLLMLQQQAGGHAQAHCSKSPRSRNASASGNTGWKRFCPETGPRQATAPAARKARRYFPLPVSSFRALLIMDSRFRLSMPACDSLSTF